MIEQVDLSQTRSRDDAVQAVRQAWKEQQRKSGTGEEDQAGQGLGPTWLLGGGWDEAKWGGEFPDKRWLDEVRIIAMTRKREQLDQALCSPPSVHLFPSSAGSRPRGPRPPVPHGPTLRSGQQ